MGRPKKLVEDKTIPVRFPLPLLAKIKEAAKLMHRSEAEIIRLCTEIGLVRLKRINYDLASVIDTAADVSSPTEVEQLRAAEKPGIYQARRTKEA
jgi:hypothetical protein